MAKATRVTNQKARKEHICDWCGTKIADPITVPRHRLEAITATLCSCGGRGPDDDPCTACAIYHAIIAEA